MDSDTLRRFIRPSQAKSKPKSLTSDDIDRQIAEFFAKGGEVECVEPGVMKRESGKKRSGRAQVKRKGKGDWEAKHG